MENNKGHKQIGSASRDISDAFVLDKQIFSNIFERDIRRVYIYKKAERLARALHLIGPAFAGSPALRNRADEIAIALVDAAILPPGQARGAMSRELLALSSALSIARTGGMLSDMNANLIGREARLLLQEIAGYEEPRLFMEDAPTLAELARGVGESSGRPALAAGARKPASATSRSTDNGHKGHGKEIKDKTTDRREAILSVLSSKGPSYIKDISTLIRDVSEKTVQRELQALVAEGVVDRRGAKRWTTYALRDAPAAR
jgi:DNA-binding transcriptional ArsR family regulator